MDIYIAARKDCPTVSIVETSLQSKSSTDSNSDYMDLCDTAFSGNMRNLNMKELLLWEEAFRLTAEADKHVRFVAHLLSQLAENAIFVYLGLFIFSNKYEWNAALVSILIVSCVLSRALMIPIICTLVWYINVLRVRFGLVSSCVDQDCSDNVVTPKGSRTVVAIQDKSIQLVLVLAGLRGAISLALVENVPLYNAVTGNGSEFKPELKAMTSAAIIFTLFIFGGSAYYILGRLNIPSDAPEVNDDQSFPGKDNRKERGRINTTLLQP